MSLILYLPWCNEDELIGSYASYRDPNVAISGVVEHNAHAFFLHSEEINTAMKNKAENGLPEIVWDTITPTIEEENVCESDLIIFIMQKVKMSQMILLMIWMYLLLVGVCLQTPHIQETH